MSGAAEPMKPQHGVSAPRSCARRISSAGCCGRHSRRPPARLAASTPQPRSAALAASAFLSAACCGVVEACTCLPTASRMTAAASRHSTAGALPTSPSISHQASSAEDGSEAGGAAAAGSCTACDAAEVAWRSASASAAAGAKVASSPATW